MDTSANSCAELHCSLSSVELELDMEVEVEVESDLSMAFERDEEAGRSPAGGSCDELPAFEIRAFCPHGRTPSPIDDLALSDLATPKQQPHPEQLQHPTEDNEQRELRHNNPDFVALHEINAQISPPSDAEANGSKGSICLETIFEGVFLQTPPRDKPNSPGSPRFTPKRCRANLMELVAIGNRLNGGKENQSPGTHQATPKEDPT
ncbi:hypothetical protein KR018_010092 [Drosophila ironensis]|nr:hypothetical protein KR018_010092 [Drosophila ironensis]